MKGIVLEELKDKLIVLTKDGEFIEVDKPNNSADIGEEIEINMAKRKRKQIFKGLVSAVAVFLLLFIGSYSAYGYYIPQGYVNVDINPSVEISYNLFGTPIKLQGLNEDGNKVIKKIGKFSHKSIDVAVDEIIKAAKEEKFISKEKENIILITVTELNKKIDDESLRNSVDNYIDENKIMMKTIFLKGNKTIYGKAKEQGISPGKLILAEQAVEKDSGNESNDVNEKSIREIMDITNNEEEKKNKPNNLQKEKTDKEMSSNTNYKIKTSTYQKTRIEKEENKSVNIQSGKKEKEEEKSKGEQKEDKNQQKEIYSIKQKEDKEQHKQKQEKEKEK
ncbi:anti-sigma factor domain-containing protein [Clostridium sp. DJ247]|uniref:anti-sigma factor domain-containing protein n=1 Tax=Clostridium sp. DJ247 TaxID=2726188 RepID=UPI001A9B2D2B|nr:anti-sigma factor domain-containing protein [Clostridium sp. DJ247]